LALKKIFEISYEKQTYRFNFDKNYVTFFDSAANGPTVMYSAPSKVSDVWSIHGIRINNQEKFSISGTSSKLGMVLAFEGNDLVYFGGSISKTHSDGTLT
jgi:hypothetical protein